LLYLPRVLKYIGAMPREQQRITISGQNEPDVYTALDSHARGNLGRRGILRHEANQSGSRVFVRTLCKLAQNSEGGLAVNNGRWSRRQIPLRRPATAEQRGK